jgi:hypothetical protein
LSPIPQHAHRAADAPPDQRAQAPAPEQAPEPSAAIVQQSSKTAEKTKPHAQPAPDPAAITWSQRLRSRG